MADVTVYFATNRNNKGSEKNPDFGERFQEEGAHYVRYGRAVLQKPRGAWSDDYKVKQVELFPESIPTDRKGAQLLGSAAAMTGLRDLMVKQDCDSLVYIHGFANDFASSLARAAELKVRYAAGRGRELNVFVFSWPTNGKMVPWISYYSDRADARGSGLAVARSLLRLRAFLREITDNGQQCNQSLHLVAHSMGNYVLRQAIQAVKKERAGRPLERIFDHVFLMAADEDDDTFEKPYKLAALPELARAVHVYYSEDDQALKISDKTKGNPDRLGSQGPRLKDNLPRKIVLVDCADVDETELLHTRHQYYRQREEVVADVRQVLAGVPPRQIKGRIYLPDERSYRILAKKSRPRRKAK